MTTVSPPTTVWTMMPGWGIATNLLPPEILAKRRVRVLRKRVIGALLAVMVVGGAGYGYAYHRVSQASSQLASVQAQTAAQNAEVNRHTGVVTLQSEQNAIRSQLRTLTAKNVDVAAVSTAIVQALPAGATLSALSTTISVGTPAAPVAAPTATNPLDTAGRTQVGTVALTGQARSLDDVARYAAALARVHGVAAAYPTSEQGSPKAGIEFAIQVTLDDALLPQLPTPAPASPTGGK